MLLKLFHAAVVHSEILKITDNAILYYMEIDK